MYVEGGGMNLLTEIHKCMHKMLVSVDYEPTSRECACAHLCMCVSPGVCVYSRHLEVLFIFTACFAQAADSTEISSSL